MESAVYLSATNKVYGVRGQWIYECDPASGSVLRSGRFCDNVVFGSNIIAIGTKLYVGVIYTDRYSYNSIAFGMPNLDIYVVDPTLLPFPSTTQFNFDGTGPNGKFIGVGAPYRILPGWSSLVTDGTLIYGYSAYQGQFKVDPANLASYLAGGQINLDGLALDTSSRAGFTGPFLWMSDSRGFDIWVWNGDFTDQSSDTGGIGTGLGGITLCNSTMKVYAVKGTEDFYVVNGNAPFSAPPFLSNFAVSVLHTAPVAGVVNPQPARIRACNVIGHPSLGKVFIPTMKGDSVIVWDSASDNPALAVCKTGFSAPYDIVFTPTKTFAVQNSSAGLKEVV